MTALGIDASDRDPVTVLTDPVMIGKPMPPLVAKYWAKLQDVRKQVDLMTDCDGPIPELTAALAEERRIEKIYSALYDVWQRHYWEDDVDKRIAEVHHD